MSLAKLELDGMGWPLLLALEFEVRGSPDCLLGPKV